MVQVSYTIGTHLDQPVPDEAPTGDYMASFPVGSFITEPGTKDFFVHPATSGYVVEMDSGRVVDLTA